MQSAVRKKLKIKICFPYDVTKTTNIVLDHHKENKFIFKIVFPNLRYPVVFFLFFPVMLSKFLFHQVSRSFPDPFFLVF